MGMSINACCQELNKLFKKHKTARATLSAEFLREIVERQRLEDSFIESLNELSKKEYEFIIVRLSRNKFLFARTSDKYLEEDTYNNTED